MATATVGGGADAVTATTATAPPADAPPKPWPPFPALPAWADDPGIRLSNPERRIELRRALISIFDLGAPRDAIANGLQLEAWLLGAASATEYADRFRILTLVQGKGDDAATLLGHAQPLVEATRAAAVVTTGGSSE